MNCIYYHCRKPGGSCSYVSHHYKSQCSQVYNYHRLLSWTKDRGLHMDIFKVPTCCSCHIMGYSYVYPPLRQGSKSRPIPSTTNTFKPSQSLDDGFVEGQQGFRPPFQHSPQFEDVGEEPEFFREPPPPPPSPPRRPVRPQAPLRDEFDPSVVFQEVVNGFGEESGDEFSSNDLEYVDIDGPSGSNDDFDEFMQSLTNQFPDSESPLESYYYFDNHANCHLRWRLWHPRDSSTLDWSCQDSSSPFTCPRESLEQEKTSAP